MRSTELLTAHWAELAKRITIDERLTLVLTVSLVLVLSFRSWQPLTDPGFPVVHDDVQAVRLLEMDRCFGDGQFPCRWAQDLSEGYGYPVFAVGAPPLPYYVGELIHLTGFSFLTSVEILYGLALVLSALSMFLLGRELWGNLGGLVASTFYVYAPYHAVDMYVRGSMGELWAYAFLPAILWGIYQVLSEGKLHQVLLLSLFISLLLLSHSPTAMVFVAFAVLWAAVVAWKTRNFRNLRLLALSGLLTAFIGLLLLTDLPTATMFLPVGLIGAAIISLQRNNVRNLVLIALSGLCGISLAAFFLLPARLEQQFVYVWPFTYDGYNYSKHFVYLDQLFTSRFWGYGGSVEGGGDGLSFQVGWLHWSLTVGSLMVAPLLWRCHKFLVGVILFFIFTFGAAVFMTLEQSSFIWDAVSDMWLIVFPWRFLVVVALASSALAGSFFVLTKGRPLLALLLAIVLILGVTVLNDQYFAVGGVDFVTDSEKFAGGRWKVQTAGSFWTLVVYAETHPLQPPFEPVDVVSGEARVTNVRRGSASMAFTATTSRGATLRPAIHDYPEWKVRVDGETVTHDHENTLGLITFDLSAGSHEISLNLENTRLRSLADGVSMVAWAAFVVSWVGLAGAYVVGKVRRNSSASEKISA